MPAKEVYTTWGSIKLDTGVVGGEIASLMNDKEFDVTGYECDCTIVCHQKKSILLGVL